MKTKDFNKRKEDYYNKEAKNWDLKESSTRPSTENIKHYNQLVKSILGNKKNPKIVVLGSTPEIRDLLYKYYFLNKAKIVCLEFLPAMYYGMSNLVKHRAPNEKFIQADWLKMPFKKESIDIFIGDLICGNIYEKTDQEKLLELIRKCLKKNGAFISRHVSVTPKARIKNIKQHLFNFIPQLLNEEISINAAATSFLMDLVVSSWYKNKENRLSMVYLRDDIKKLQKYFERKNLSAQDKIAKVIFDHSQILGGKKRYWTFGDKKQEEKIFEKYFRIEKILFAKDFYSAPCCPIYCLKPKK